MKIAIISRNPKLYSTRRMAEEIEAKGHEVRVIDPGVCVKHKDKCCYTGGPGQFPHGGKYLQICIARDSRRILAGLAH